MSARNMRERLIKRFRDPEYRHTYLNAFLNTVIAAQIRALRESRGWSQSDLAEQIGTQQSGVSALENVNYSKWSINTLRKLARAFDLALVVKFVSFGEALEEVEGFEVGKLVKPSFEKDPAFKGGEQKGGDASTSDSFRLINFPGNSVRATIGPVTSGSTANG